MDARYILLDTTHADYTTAIDDCSAAATAAWPGNLLGCLLSVDESMALVKVPGGFTLAGAVVLDIHDTPPRAMLAGPDWYVADDMDPAP